MRVFVIAILACVLSAVCALAHSAMHRHASSSSSSSSDMDLLQAVNHFMCATGSKHCLDFSSSRGVDYRQLRNSLVLRTLEYTHEMVHPRTAQQKLALRALPKEAQHLFQLARTRHYKAVAAGAPAVTHHRASARAVLDAWKSLRTGADQYAIFGFIPQWAGDALVGGAAATFNTKCFGSVSLTATVSGSVVTSTTQASSSGFLCSDVLILLAGAHDFRLQIVENASPITWQFDTSAYTTEEKWYLSRHGVRALKFPKNLLDTIGQVITTVTTMSGFAELPLTNQTLTDNIQFLADYVEASPRMQPYTKARTAGSTVAEQLPSDYIQSGDSIIVMRPDGVDPMIAWGEGWTSGHSTIAMRDGQGNLHVCESTTHDTYWPTNGIQCTAWAQWIKQVTAAQMSALVAPLAPKFRAAFNASKAWDFFHAHSGINYGFANFLFGWIDRPTSNFPCLPPDYKTCLDEQAVEQIVILADRLLGDANTNIFRQAINHRTGTTGLTALAAFYSAWQKNNAITLPQIYTMPEQDSWKYNMTLNNGSTVMARSQVCCVFVCNMWKAAGVFSSIGDQLNCGEQDLYDIYSMAIFDPNAIGGHRPAVCIRADPDNQLCQLTGVLTLHAKPDFNTRALYPHMGEKCSSKCPNYVREPGC